MAAVTSKAHKLWNRVLIAARVRRAADLSAAAVLDQLHRVQAAQPGHHGAADRRVRADRHAVRQAVHHARADARRSRTPRSTPRRPGTRSGCSTRASASSRTPTASIESSGYWSRFLNSIIIAVTSTFLAVAMGTLTAYGFSRFRMPGEQDWLFFILQHAHAAAGGGGDPDVPDVPHASGWWIRTSD